MDYTQALSLTDLPLGLQYDIVGLLDRRSLGNVALTSKPLKDVVHSVPLTIRVPNSCNGRDMLSAPLSGLLRSATRLTLSGDYPNLHPSCVDDFIRTQIVSLLQSSSNTHTLHVTGHLLASPPDTQGLPFSSATTSLASSAARLSMFPPLSLSSCLLTELHLHGVRLPQPFPFHLLMALPEIWPALSRLELVDTRLGCPLSCTKRESLERTITALSVLDSVDLHHSLLVGLVDEHEQRLNTNIQVSLELCRMISKLSMIKSLVLRGPAYLHLHNMTVLEVAKCNKLEKLEMDLPEDWPRVTEASLSSLPITLRSLTLSTPRPVTYLKKLAVVSAFWHPDCKVHMQVHHQSMMLMRETLDSFEMEYGLLLIQNTEAAAAAAAAASVTVGAAATPSSLMTPGAAAAPRSAPPAVSSWGGDRQQGGVLHPGMGSTSLAATLWNGSGASAVLQTQDHTLDSIQIWSSVPDLDPEELETDHATSWFQRQLRESAMLRFILTSAPRLRVLDLVGVGPVLFSKLVELLTVVGVDLKVPSQSLRLSCHSSVSPMTLMYLKHQYADVSLTLRGVGRLELLAVSGGQHPVRPSSFHPEASSSATAAGTSRQPAAGSEVGTRGWRDVMVQEEGEEGEMQFCESSSCTEEAEEEAGVAEEEEHHGMEEHHDFAHDDVLPASSSITTAFSSLMATPHGSTPPASNTRAASSARAAASAGRMLSSYPTSGSCLSGGSTKKKLELGGHKQQGKRSVSGSGAHAGEQLTPMNGKKKKPSRKEAAKAAAAAAREREQQLTRKRAQQAAAAAAEAAWVAANTCKWKDLIQGQAIYARLVQLHLQRSHDVEDDDVAGAVQRCKSLKYMFLTTCRAVSPKVVTAVAKLKRALLLRCTSCRLISLENWLDAVMEAKRMKGVIVLDLIVPSYEDAACEVKFGP
ncbi:hypothetical protein CEUSTIGMA_g1826.t1 [Chlamydomonas eustigma]|uniref:F-box domain-containing protein n=1 Tax=Chlamydomonas eustigma TaxID=1157962 RepID=A0A250WU81_9CHLO|nr:hypothetical protein CEUSTIGMA_g1826.t1 [Chlamydomonas eustigma]|eukprot:GAX74378.1 hypothetical protein CEUSTIGMA_g1826.t1 [Chlamydomonas eustigma]